MLIVRWMTPDSTETIRRLRDRFGFHVDESAEPAVVRLLNAGIEIEAIDLTIPIDPTRPRAGAWERLMVPELDDATADASGTSVRGEARASTPQPVHPNGAAELLAVGWGTVDHERATAERGELRFVFAGLDQLLGGAMWLSVGERAPATVLLEPSREGPIAAALARNGEAPAALYVRVRPRRWDALATELTRRGARVRGPETTGLGPTYLAVPDRPWGPFVLFVRVPSNGGAAGDHGEGRHAG